ncbi:MAG: NAD(P)/FAD-dependent oxidoreductase [Nitrospinae bacterium]|nr:NAD(P)/FAD-dependent oxidoreductase [Nitrospinota bacterium]
MSGNFQRLVVIGNGIAGTGVIENVLAQNKPFKITVFGAEPYVGYNRILLSDILSGSKELRNTLIKDGEWYFENKIRLLLDNKITAIDPVLKTVRDADGNVTPFDKLVIATGSNPTVPDLPGVDKRGIFTFRNMMDADEIITFSKGRHTAAVIGGGLLGIEAGISLANRGLHVTIFHHGDRLMGQQLDDEAGLILKKELERKGIGVNLGHSAVEIIGNGSVEGIAFSNGKAYQADLVVMSTGITPNVDLAKRAGLLVARGIIVNDFMETDHPDVYAIGECAEHRGKTYGIIAPIRDQAKAAARAITGLNDFKYEGTVPATTLKVAGIDLVSIGEFLGNSPGSESLVYSDRGTSKYKKVVLQGNRVVGAILMGGSADHHWLQQLVKNKTDVTLFRDSLLFGETQDKGSRVAVLNDDDVVCGCMGVTKKTVVGAIQEHGLTSREEIGEKTKACTSCKSCGPLLDQMLQEVLGGDYVPVGEKPKSFCACFTCTKKELVAQIRTYNLKAVSEVLAKLGNGRGCTYCKPALSYLLSEIWAGNQREERGAKFINDRVHANIQKDGTFSVVPRIYGGITSPNELRKIADVADKFRVPMVKITGGQRIDLLGVSKEKLPLIWAELGMPSGHAYAKATRTVKTCVGSTFCRFGVQDSVSFGIEMEKLFEGLHTPHKLKMAVSGCPRNCAESYVKDIGIVAIQSGWEIYVGGAAGMSVRKGDLLATCKTNDETMRIATLFLQYYREQGNYLERTYDFVLRVGIEKIKRELLDSESEKTAVLLEHFKLAKLAVTDPWKSEVEKPFHATQFMELAVTNG